MLNAKLVKFLIVESDEHKKNKAVENGPKFRVSLLGGIVFWFKENV